MRAIVKDLQGKGLTYKEISDLPNPGADEVQVKVSYAGICGTDYHIYAWDEWSQNRVETPRIIGHEFVGTIHKIGPSVTDFELGQRVSAECHITCGKCFFCRTGKGHLCQETEILGVDRDGAFAQYINVPAGNLWRVADDVKDEHAAIYDPIGNAMHAVTKANVGGRSVLINGGGPIGLMAVAIAKERGARLIVVVEPQEQRRRMAEELGADLALAPNDKVLEKVKAITAGVGMRIVLEMSGHPQGINAALDIAQRGATFIQMGIPSVPVELDIAEKIVFKEITMSGVVGREMFRTWYQVDAFVRENPKAVEKLVSHILPAADFKKGMDAIENGECIKAVLKF